MVAIRSRSFPEMDMAGAVEKVGSKVTRFKAGDPVYAYLSFKEQGGYAEFTIAKENETALKPKNINFEQAAAVPLADFVTKIRFCCGAVLRPLSGPNPVRSR